MVTFLQELEAVLNNDERFVSQDGQLLKPRIQDAITRLDSDLLRALLASTSLRSYFFKDVDGITVFDQEKFMWVVNSKEFLPDSYTSYRNKIGLSANDHDLLTSSNEVSLVWPYKDCVLEGGQDKEDEKRDEVFYSETLAPDEVGRLLAPKVFSNAIRYTAEGEERVTEFDEHDNLLIKGNNLLALSSLLERYEGRVKCIYIDPPYNTGTDSFGYNDRFNRSTWLTFMKNRMELAKKLLTPDGAIYVQLDYHQVHYAKVLMDEVFGERNFEREIVWRIGWISGYKSADNNWIRNHDTILFYAKDASQLKFTKSYIPRQDFKNIAASEAQRYPIEDVWNGNEYDDLNSIAIVSFSGETVSKMLNKDDEVKGQKPEKLLQRIFRAHTNPGDIVLDFFGGSGTTAAAAHKMGLQYIVCEQLDEHSNITLRRMGRVLAGEQSGISRSQDWRGGGSFVYVELAEQGEKLMSELQDATTSDAVQVVLDRATERGLLRPSVLPDQLAESSSEFEQLSLDDQKRAVAELIDKNRLYVNASDVGDTDLGLSEADIAFTKSFYTKDK
ncbi:DNA methyltransferase [Kocuria rhizophila]|uniref:DNA methyltransferase n=1 Tax=Kocuria rhizophila TaxID=72000 RepID=UPI0007503DF6|nr:site-specific DNA-methyltransferase [Kocuria rhizophila]KUP28139.1 DNA methylase N-4/N-6 domain-containing protein [Kocuria rhizophila]